MHAMKPVTSCGICRRLVLVAALPAVFATLLPATAAADSPPVVKSLQAPAWIESGGERRPLSPGMTLNDRDQISTGSGARVLIQLSDTCEVKLGENSQFNLDRIKVEGDKTDAAILNVPKGVFHFRIAPGDKGEENNLRILASNLSASFNGADVWGSSGPDSDRLCLLDGQIKVEHGADEPFVMANPMTCYEASRAGGSGPVMDVDKAALEIERAARIELTQGAGVQSKDGAWQINLMTARDGERLIPMQKRLADAGYMTTTQDLFNDETPAHRLVLAGFPDRADARSIADRLEGRYGIIGAWISQTQAANPLSLTPAAGGK